MCGVLSVMVVVCGLWFCTEREDFGNEMPICIHISHSTERCLLFPPDFTRHSAHNNIFRFICKFSFKYVFAFQMIIRLIGKRVVDFLLVLIELFCLYVTTDALKLM